MWLKLPASSGPHFWPLSDQGSNLFVTGGSDRPIGIYAGALPNLPRYEPCARCGELNYSPATDDPVLLMRFHRTEHAVESLSNLFKVWARNRNALYLTPQGNMWVLPDLKEKPKE